MEYYLGIDIGGTSAKVALLTENGSVVKKGSVLTPWADGASKALDAIAGLCKGLCSDYAVRCAGAGCPGMVDGENGEVVFAGNLYLKKYPLGSELEKRLKFPVYLTNDANAAAYGEAKFGAGKKYSDSVLITLGTGVGGGIVIGGKLFEGNKSAGAEIGHMVIVHGGEKCTCGRRGCFEAYSSATALIRDTKRAMQENENSAMWACGGTDKVTGKTAFDYAASDPAAKATVDKYIYNLACGITNIANIFRPQVVILGGGVAEQGESLVAPLQDRLDKKIFGGQEHAPVKIIKATLGNAAGAMGAAAFARDKMGENDGK